MGCEVVGTPGGTVIVCGRGGRSTGICSGIGQEPVVEGGTERCRGCGRKVGTYESEDGRRIVYEHRAK